MKHNVAERRSALQIMGRLIGLVRPLMGVMSGAILMGVLGYLCAIFLTILTVDGMVRFLGMPGFFPLSAFQSVAVLLVVLAVFRGVLHYVEQYCNHYIAFRILAVIRHKVFSALRTLCPAKLEGRDKGNLISLITSDIELLEVFYAHTISPVAIAVLTSLVMVLFMGRIHMLAGILALCAYLVVGLVLPVWNGSRGAQKGMRFRNGFGELNSFVLDSLRGLDETIQYGQGEKRSRQMEERSREMGKLQKEMSDFQAGQSSMTNLCVLVFSAGMLFLMLWLEGKGSVDCDGVLLCTVAMLGSFGPVLALSNLSNTLNQTLASGERVLQLLEEEPVVQDVTGEESVDFEAMTCDHIGFSYGAEDIIHDFSFDFAPGRIIGIYGKSGCGKSTLLKLMMRFWDINTGSIQISGRDIQKVNTTDLRDMEAYMTQETCLFHDSILNNIALGREGVTREDVMEAAKKASIHDFIMSLPKGYDTEVGELGSTLSGGEKQRIGIARMFLSDAGLWLLDEPTSNLDSLNEGIILKSVKEASKGKTVVIVSHRESTMSIADTFCGLLSE